VAQATTSIGSVSKVEFYQGSTKIGQSTTPSGSEPSAPTEAPPPGETTPEKPAAGAQEKLYDKLRGLCWRVADIDATHARLTADGVDVSEVRTGRKPGTRVMTVRNGTCGVPTLLVQPSARKDSGRGFIP